MKRISATVRWYEIVILATFIAALMFTFWMLHSLNFEKSAFLTFLGALVGVALVVLVTIRQDERRNASAKKQEARQIVMYLDTLKQQISSGSQALFAKSFDTASAQTSLTALQVQIRLLRVFVEQVVNHAKYLDFASRANLNELISDCHTYSLTLAGVHEECDKYDGKPDWESARRASTGLSNAIELAKTPVVGFSRLA